jgi:hypothetical protein
MEYNTFMEGLPQKNTEDSDAFLKNLSNTLHRAYEKAESRVTLYKLVSDFALGLEEKYPDARSRRLWHLLVMSTPPQGAPMNIEDYPGEDSIVRFIEKLNSEKS